MSQDSDEFKAAQAAVAALGECDDRISELQAIQVGTLKMLGKDAPEPAGGRGRAGDPSAPEGAAWDARSLLADEDLRSRLLQASGSKARFGGIDIGQVATRDALVADITGTTSMRRGDYGGVTRSCAAGSACWTSSRPGRWTPTRSPTPRRAGRSGRRSRSRRASRSPRRR
jgi:hypothetical protein